MQALSRQLHKVGQLRDRGQIAGVGLGRTPTSAGATGDLKPEGEQTGQATDGQGDSKQSKTHMKVQGCAHPICVMLKISPDVFKHPFCLVHSHRDVRMTPKTIRIYHYVTTLFL